jgi:hypothetical protein
MHIYAFGSLCRGEVDIGSDVDLLLLSNDGTSPRVNMQQFSVYTYERMLELWNGGNPFAWHLATEARLIYSGDRSDYIGDLKDPAPYVDYPVDCRKFLALFEEAYQSVSNTRSTIVFDLGTIFLSIRNLATCYALGVLRWPIFSRDAALRIGGKSVPIDVEAYAVLERARLLSTRGQGDTLSEQDLEVALRGISPIQQWMKELAMEAEQYV